MHVPTEPSTRDARWAAVLDPQVLARLAELDPTGSHGLVERVVRTFEASLVKLQDQLRQAVQAGDIAAVRYVAHTLKSSSASVGALNLSRQCAGVERRVREGLTDGLAADVDGLLDEIERVRTGLSRRSLG